MDQRINIRPGVSMLSVLAHLKYEYWYALAEFVDNALQSWLAHHETLVAADPLASTLRVSIQLSPDDGGRIVIRDNAMGIPRSEFGRAFKPAALPMDRSGLSEFGMGMKSAACWCARQWSVRTKALGESFEHVVRFDIERIVAGEIEELDVNPTPAPGNHHYTEIRLEILHKVPTGRTIGKIKQHLADIYRDFFRRGVLELYFDGELLKYDEPAILSAPYFRDEGSAPRLWRATLSFDFGAGLSAHGFAAIRERASTSRAGFALFRRGRVIQGSGDQGYRPEQIFGKSNSFVYQRVFGELHLEGFEVTHTKDGFRWDENEEVFLQLLREELSKDELPLLQQAKGYRIGERTEDLQRGADIAAENVVAALERNAPAVVALLRENQDESPVPQDLAPRRGFGPREIRLSFPPWTWIVTVEQSIDPACQWLEIADGPSRPSRSGERRLGLRMSLQHPFVQRFAGADPDLIEPILRLAVAIGLGEIIAREGAMPGAFGRVRENVNELLRSALSAP